MRIPSVTVNSSILKLIVSISMESTLIRAKNYHEEIIRHIDRASILKSSLYSARIEGNTLEEHTIELGDEQSKLEVFNLIDAVSYIRTIPARQPLTKQEVLRLHAMVMRNLSADAGKLRTGQNAIFDSSGAVRYLPPPPNAMRRDFEKLILYANTPAEFPMLTAIVSHLIFEKLHPFIDGNGRVGRLLIPFILKSHGEELPLVVPFERYLEKQRAAYYRYLDIGSAGLEEYVVFMLRAILEELQSAHKEIDTQNREPNSLLLLTPRQRELYALITEHRYVSIDTLQRRFIKIPIRTIRYDIAVLMRKKLVKKVGTTRGAVYEIVKD